MSMPSRRALVTALAAACVLTACKEPSPPIDFAPMPAANVTIYGLPVPTDKSPVEMGVAERTVPLRKGGPCNFERIGTTPVGVQPFALSKANPAVVEGWIVDTEAKNVPRNVHLRFVLMNGTGQTWKSPVAANLEREDVQKLVGGDARYRMSGYSTQIDFATLPDGLYRTYAVFVRNDVLFVCDNGRAITLGP